MKGFEFFGNIRTRISNLWRKFIKRLGKKTLEEQLKDNLIKRYPHFPQYMFTPFLALKSPCCEAVLWEFYWGLGELFCDKCGKRYQLVLKPMYGRRTLDELYKYLLETSAEEKKTQ